MFRHCFEVLSTPGQGSQGWWVEDKATPKQVAKKDRSPTHSMPRVTTSFFLLSI